MTSRILARTTALATGLAGLVVAYAPPAQAADFVPGAGTYAVDTTTLTITGPGVGLVGSDRGGVAVFSFDNVTILSGVTLVVSGSRPFRLQASGALSLFGIITADGVSATDLDSVSTQPGGPGGGAGATSTPGAVGGGPGGGRPAAGGSGGGGGGFGGRGAAGGVDSSSMSSAGQGGAAYGDLSAALRGAAGADPVTRRAAAAAEAPSSWSDRP